MTSEPTQDWVDGVVCGLIRSAARRAPDSLTERLEEEWLADLSERHGRLARLRFGIGCCRAMSAIMHDHGTAVIPATAAPAGRGYFATVSPHDFPYLSTRTTTFLLIVSLHAALLYGLVIGLSSKFAIAIPTSFVAHVIEAPPRGHLPPLPFALPQPHLNTTKIELPPQEPMPSIESEQTDVLVETAPVSPHSLLPQATPTMVSRILGGPGVGFPSTNDFYPDSAIRRGEEGVATLSACVDAKGRLGSEPTIIHSAGDVRLDEAALKLARAGSGHYRATTEDGKPIDSCYSFRIRFELRK